MLLRFLLRKTGGSFFGQDLFRGSFVGKMVVNTKEKRSTCGDTGCQENSVNKGVS